MQKATIMIVEDERIIADDLRNSLERMDYRVSSVVSSAGQVVAAVERDRPDLVLMDIMLKGEMDGIDAAESIQRFNIPHIFINACGDEGKLEEAKRTEPFGYLLKPFDDRELKAAIEIALYKHKREAKLRGNEERFKGLVETTADWIWEVDENGVYIYVSPGIKGMLGYEPEEVLGLKPFDLMPPDEAKRIADTFGLIAASQKEFKNLENMNLRKDGSPVILETSGVPVFDAGGVFRGYRGIDRDISARKKAEEDLRNRNQLLINIIESLTHPFYVVNVADYSIELANAAALRLNTSGATTCYALSHQRSEPCRENGYPCVLEEIIKTKRPATVEHIHYDEHGKPKVVEVHGYPIFNEESVVSQIIEYNLDITDRKKAEQERERLNNELEMKNKEMEQLLYITSHDLRTPLAIIHGYAREFEITVNQIVSVIDSSEQAPVLKKRLDPYIKDIQDINTFIRSNVRKMDALLFGLLKLSRSGNVELNLETLDMNRLAADVKGSFDFKIREAGARVEISDLPACIGDKDQINQVFSNLLGNALKYLRPGRPGSIRISGYREGSRSLYCVEDNGVGIGSGECDRIFNMFYRVDTAVPGEGLGLTIVRKILERHGGSIRVESGKGRGSRFYVALPGEGGKSREREMGKKRGQRNSVK
jgi:PAS domain S-box-containing protein